MATIASGWSSAEVRVRSYLGVLAMVAVLATSSCAGTLTARLASPVPAQDQHAAAGQAYLRLTTEATSRWRSAAAMACNRKAANEEPWPVMAEFFAAQASIDRAFVSGLQQIPFPPDLNADVSAAAAAFLLRADDYARVADQERAHHEPDLTALHKDGATAVAAARRLRADLGVATTVPDLTASCDLSH